MKGNAMKKGKNASPATTRRVVVAAAQFAVVPNDIAANVERIIHYLRRAAREVNAKLLVLPESITTGYNPAMPPAELYDFLPRTAALLAPSVPPAASCTRVVPTYERGPKRGVVYNLPSDSRMKLGAYARRTFPTERLKTTLATGRHFLLHRDRTTASTFATTATPGNLRMGGEGARGSVSFGRCAARFGSTNQCAL